MTSRQRVRSTEAPDRHTDASAEKASAAPELHPGWEAIAGNRAYGGLLSVAQASLSVGAANDPAEHEADLVAREVVARLHGPWTRTGGGAAVEDVAPEAVARRVQRRSAASPEGGQLDSDTEAAVQSARSGGSPLPDPTRTRMEGAFGARFGDVRLHTGAESEMLNRAVGAQAFTLGSDIFFRDGSPTGRSGDSLLAHELTHVIQQGAAPVNPTPDAAPL